MSRRSLSNRLDALEDAIGDGLSDADLWRTFITWEHPHTGYDLDVETYVELCKKYRPEEWCGSQ